MNTMSFSQWILAATFVVAAVLVSVALARLVRRDGYGASHLRDARSDWGTASMPSLPYSSRF
jgi:hypothetical protein